MPGRKEKIAVVLLTGSFIMASLSFAPSLVARQTQERNRTVKPTRADGPPLSPEPLMRIALSTNTRSATISTTAHLLTASAMDAEPQPLQTARVQIESRLLSQSQQTTRNIEIQIARSLSRDEADRLIDSVHQMAGEEARAVSEADGKWRVIVLKSSIEEAEITVAILEDAGFDASTSFQRPTAESRLPAKNANDSSPLPPRNGDPKTPGPPVTNIGSETKSVATLPMNSVGLNRVRLTSRASAPNRELVAFARGLAPLRSSAPITFASSDERNAPVRFNDKPYRGRIEVFANTRGALTVVNVIGLEDYVRGVVPNELSYPALEALKAQAIAARTYALKNRGQFAPEGFDLLPTTRSQVYRGLSSETSLTTRAVDETRGIVAHLQRRTD